MFIAPETTVRVSWGALFAGTAVALASWLLLYAFGIAAGLSAIDPNDLTSARVSGLGTGVWSILAPLIALFVGGFVTARLVRTPRRGETILHGVVVWALTSLAAFAALGMLLSSLMTGLVGLGGEAIHAAGAATSTALMASSNVDANRSPLEALGLRESDLMAPVNQRLTAQGLPPVTAGQLDASMRDALRTMIRNGSFNREAILASLTQNTALTRSEAEQIATSVESQYIASRARVEQGMQEAKRAAAVVADRTGKVMWGVSLALLVALGSAIGGAALGGGSETIFRRRRGVGHPIGVHATTPG
jgi:hypothetical protein